MTKFVDRWQDSLYHYSTHVGLRGIKLYWRCFAYDVLRWPDGLHPKTFEKHQQWIKENYHQ